MKAWSLVVLVTAVGLGGCSSTATRLANPLDRPVLPLLPGPVERTVAGAVPPAMESEGGSAATAPAQRSYVVLLADDDGRVGQVEVESGGERIVLDRANHGVDFSNLSESFEAGPSELVVFDRARAAEPPSALQLVVHFELNQAEPSPAEVQRFSAALDPVRAWKAPEFSIAGHADRRGADSLNQDLSARRAAAVRRLLATEGLTPVALEVMAFGESQPAVATEDGVPEARNRRVVVTIR